MPSAGLEPTPHAPINALLHELLLSVQTILGGQFVGIYVDGSLTSGALDVASDIDFMVVTADEVSDDEFGALRAMHQRIIARALVARHNANGAAAAEDVRATLVFIQYTLELSQSWRAAT